MHESDGWESHAASIATSLLAADPVACLRIDSRITPQSFRYPAAMLYALAGNEEAAVEILTRHIEYEIPAPPGGWRIFDGTPRPDANKPRTRTTPTPKETQHDTMQLLEDLARCPNAAERIPPLSLVIVRTLTEQIHTTENDADLRMYMSTLATVLKMTVVAMDPLPRVLRTDQPAPPAHEVDMARFTPLCDVVREVLTDDKVAKCGLLLVNDGLRDALLTARNPALLQALTTLSITCIERYAQAHQRPHYATDARLSLANYLSGRKGYDMTPYITQLTAAATE